jgi:hypothetical protein
MLEMAPDRVPNQHGERLVNAQKYFVREFPQTTMGEEEGYS